MAFWLMKSEPESYSWEDLVRDGTTAWDGVRNNLAALNLKAMAVGDEAFFYRSVEAPAVVGVMRVTRAAFPDAKDASGRWVAVQVEPVRAIGPVALSVLKATPSLAKMQVLTAFRLSVARVTDDEWAEVLRLAG
ncbi:EVE domain-containing protein [Sandaracinobacteroides saxicola]|uniref:EVE domain-containing protein n=1 Tax=Sandaracinobacteroides saxicola TaxID=2759707 RepID=A0A7G5IDW4_9SPHN|nr:EVE domain-containing protein [Sandaracinobacteroides saxicola]QMW21556.1 EVE domain-containing protein [Sandaracinobacteroides saxicola]